MALTKAKLQEQLDNNEYDLGVTGGTYNRATSELTGANVFDDIVVSNGVVTGTSTRALAAGDIFGLVYPVGSIYISVVSTNPGTLFGGTWEAWGAGRVPVGIDAGQTEFNTVEETGGAKTHVHALSDGYANFTASVSSTGIYYARKTQSFTATHLAVGASNGSTDTTTVSSAMTLGGNTNSGSSLPPYIVCYMWKRTA